MKDKKTLQRAGWTALTGLMLWLAIITAQSQVQVTLPKVDEPAILYSTQARHDLRETYLTAIASAEHSILLIIYALNDNRIINALKRKAAQGVVIEVICDHKASRGVARRLGPSIQCHYRKGKGLMHQKILSVDKSLLLIGSANMTTESLRHHGNLITAVHSRALAKAVEQHSRHLVNPKYYPSVVQKNDRVGGQNLELHLLPADSKGLDQIVGYIRSAQKTVKVAMYTWTHPILADAVIAARERGVEVQILIDRSTSRSASRQVTHLLAGSSVDVAVNDNPALLHYKMLIVDDTMLVSGSANWTRAAFNKNDDCFVVIPRLNEAQRDVLQKLWHAAWCQSCNVTVQRAN